MKRATLYLIAILITIPAAAQFTTPSCHDQWVVQSLHTAAEAYAYAGSLAVGSQPANPPQVMPTGDSMHPFIVAYFTCADLWVGPDNVTFRITDRHEAEYLSSKWTAEVYDGTARSAGIHPFGNGKHMAWVIREPDPGLLTSGGTTR